MAGKHNGLVLRLREACVTLALFVLGATFYGLVWPATPDGGGDYGSYALVAREFGSAAPSKMQLRPPGYPLVLALTGSSETPSSLLFLVQMGLHFTAVWFVSQALSRAGVGRRSVLVFTVVMLLPPFMEPTAYSLTESLNSSLVALGVTATTYAVLRGNGVYGWGAGLLFGYCGITHPMLMLVGVAVSLCVCGLAAAGMLGGTRRGRLLRVNSGVFLGSLVPVGGLLLYNGVVFNYWRPSPFTGYALSTKTVKTLERLPARYEPLRSILIEARDKALIKANSSHSADNYIWDAKDKLEAQTGWDTKELSEWLTEVNLNLIRRAPAHYASAVVHSAVGLWFPSSGARANLNSSALQGAWFLVNGLMILTFWIQLPVVVTLGTLWRRGRLADSRGGFPMRMPGYALLYCGSVTAALYVTVIVSFFGTGEPRFLRPVYALILVSCILGVDAIYRLGVFGERHSGDLRREVVA